MRQQAAGLGGGSMSRLHTVASEQDRIRAFRAARRHTGLVRLLRFVLPTAAIILVGAYGARLAGTAFLRPKGVEIANVRIDTKNLVMETPSYDGFGNDGSRYQVRAREAIADIRQKGPIRLNAIDGTITQTTGAVTKLEAVWGTYDQKTEVLELHEKIDVDSSTGMKARLTRATVHPKESRVSSNEPVWARTDTGTITAKAMTLDTKARRATFTDDVHVHMEPAAARATSAATPPKASASPLPGLTANSDQPIEVRAAALAVDDVAKTALFRHDVVARQGEAVLEAPELDVVYAGSASTATATTPTSTPAQSAKLETIRARGGVATRNKADRATSDTLEYHAPSERAALRGNVVMNSGADRRVTAHTADFDQKADTALLTGNVVAMQGRNVLKGQRLLVDRKQGHTRLDSPGTDRGPVGRISTVFYRTDQAATAAKPAAAPSEPTGPLAVNFKTDPTAPIEVDAETLDVLDAKHTAVFKGNVVAKQADFVMRTVEMTAHYTGQTGLGSVPPPINGATRGENTGGAQLTRIEARQKVVVTSKDGREVIGDWADFDTKSNIIIVGGKVTVTDGRSSIDGPDGSRLVIDMTSGRSHFEQAPGGRPVASGKALPAVSNAAPATSAASDVGGAATKAGTPPCPEGLVCSKKQFRLVLYPKQVEAKAKEQIDKVQRDGSSPALDAAKDIAREKRARRAKSESSSWEATTSDNAKSAPR
jgi:LPS export ABC transporter protein LptC